MSERALFGAVLLAATATLTGCGGSGDSVASTPAPPAGPTATSIYALSRTSEIGAELPLTPATIAGTYETIGIRSQVDANGKQIAVVRLDPLVAPLFVLLEH